MEASNLREENEKFSLSTWNIVMVVLFLSGTAVFFWETGRATSNQIGYAVGTCIGLFMFPYLVARLVYRLSKRSNWDGNIAFTIVLVIGFAVNIGNQWNELREQQELLALAEKMDALRDDVKRKVANGKAVDDELDNMQDTLAETLEKVGMGLQGEDREVFREYALFMKETADRTRQWMQVVEDLESAIGIDLGKVQDKEELSVLRGKAEKCSALSKEQVEQISNLGQRLEQRLERFPDDNQKKIGIIRASRAGVVKKKGPTIKAMKLHAERGDFYSKVFLLAHDHFGKWRFDPEGRTLNFEDKNVQQRYDSHVLRLAEIEAELQKVAQTAFGNGIWGQVIPLDT